MSTTIQELNQEVAARIKNSGDTIKNNVINKFVEEEVTRRAKLLTDLVVAITAFRKEFLKIQPDIRHYDDAGVIKSEAWSKPNLDKRKKFEDKLNKAEKAFEKALGENDYSNISQILNELKIQETKQPAEVPE